MFVYNPLGAHSALYQRYVAFRSAADSPPEPADATDLLRLYGRLARRPKEAPAPALVEDRRPLIARLRGFLPVLYEKAPIAEELAALPVVFPRTSVVDARSLESGKLRGAFISSGMLDAVELFARTVSACARLGQLVLPELAALERRQVEHVPLAWMSLRPELPAMTPGELFGDAGPEGVRARLFDLTRWAAARLRPGFARHLLSHVLMQMMTRALRRSSLQGWDPGYALGPEACAEASPIDREYLEVVTLAFVVLHELGHLVLGHNKIDHRGTEAEIAFSELIASKLEGAEGVESFVNFVGAQSSFEMAADGFGVEVVDAALREPVLEAASLWCAANERAHCVTGNRFDDLVEMASAPQVHPSPALRVWYLNGRFSSGRRAGPIACEVATAAESLGAEVEGTDLDRAREAALLAGLWALVPAACADGDAAWVPPDPARPDEPPVSSPERADLIRGLEAWEAGELVQAEQRFRAVAAGSAPELVAEAHGLIGRMREEQGDARAAETAYRLGDQLGDGNAANELGTLLKDRAELAAAIAAFERADARGNGPGAFNLGLIAEERGERARALEAFRRADRRGHAAAALNLGILIYQARDLDAAEAALRRAEGRGAANAATYLGIVLRERGDLRSAEAAWQRAGNRGELDALHNLALLLEGQGRLREARAAYLAAVMQGRGRSAGNLRAVSAQLAELDDTTALRSAAASGDADAAYRLGGALASRGERDAAIAAWTEAERLGDARAINELGLAAHTQGDLAAAEAAYRRGAARGHARSSYNLGVLLHERGDEEGAQAAWAQADELGDPLAATNLGSTLEAIGKLAPAWRAYERADARGDGLGAVRLGRLLERRDDLARAEAAYRRADERGDGHGAAALGRLLYNRGDAAGAEDAWRRADLRGNADAALRLGRLLRRRGDLDAAEAALRRAIERGQPDAKHQLAFLLSEAGYASDASDALMSPVGE